MNLILDKWLDVINVNNEIETVSLLELFENTRHYVSLSGAWPQKVSMCNFYNSLEGICKKGCRATATKSTVKKGSECPYIHQFHCPCYKPLENEINVNRGDK